MKMIRVIKASYQFLNYPDNNGSCYIPLQKGQVEIHTAGRGEWAVDYTTGELADLGKAFKVFDNLKDAKDYALKLAKKYDFKVYDKFASKKSSDAIQQLVDAALEGLLDDYDLGIDFLKKMGISSRGMFDENYEIDEQIYSSRIEKAIRKNPEKAAQELGILGDIYFEYKEENKEIDQNVNINKIIKEISLDASSADEFLRRMGYENYDISNEKEITKLVKEAFKNNKNKALKVASDYIIKL